MEENWFDKVRLEDLEEQEEAQPSDSATSILSVIENIQKKKAEKNTVYRSSRKEASVQIDMLEDMPDIEEERQAEIDAMDAGAYDEMEIPDLFDEQEDTDLDTDSYMIKDDDPEEEDGDQENDEYENLSGSTEDESPKEENDPEGIEKRSENEIPDQEDKTLDINDDADADADTENDVLDAKDPATDESIITDDITEDDLQEEYSVEEIKRVLSGKTSFKANKRDFVDAKKEENFVSIEVFSGGIIKGEYIGAEESITIRENAKAIGNLEGYRVDIFGTVDGSVTGDIVNIQGTVFGDITGKDITIGKHHIILEKEMTMKYEG